MRTVHLGATGLQSSALGFGCAALMGRKGQRDSLESLSWAWELGVRYFDTARSYGYGDSERLLGTFLRGRRDQAVVATKFGISAGRPNPWTRAAKDLARSTFALMPGLREAARPWLGARHQRTRFDSSSLHDSLSTSLRELAVSHVDVLHLHEPPVDVLDQDELWRALEHEVRGGRVRAVGIAGSAEVGQAAWRRLGRSLGVWQLPLGWFHPTPPSFLAEAKAAGVAVVAYGCFGGEGAGARRAALHRRLLEAYPSDSPLGAKLRSGRRELTAALGLALAYAAGADVVLASAFDRLQHKANADASDATLFTAAELSQLRDLLSATLLEPSPH